MESDVSQPEGLDSVPAPKPPYAETNVADSNSEQGYSKWALFYGFVAECGAAVGLVVARSIFDPDSGNNARPDQCSFAPREGLR